MKTVIITGSSGFIGGHLVRKLKSEGCFVIGVDIEPPKYERPHTFYNYDLRNQVLCKRIFQAHQNIDEVYNLACLMGGMGFIGDTKNSHTVMIGSSEIIANVLDCCVEHGVKKYFYSSSACAYNMNKQEETDSAALIESDAYPAMPDLMYGWQKLMGELMAQASYEQHGLEIRIARFHNIFGIEGTWDGGKEKYPAAISRKVAMAKDGEAITVWGDGKAVRSFLYIDECLEGIQRLMESDIRTPLNIGSDEAISVEDMAKMVIEISGKKLSIEHDLTKPQGVRGRNSNNELIKEKLGWAPSIPLRVGMSKLYSWVLSEVNKNK